MRTPLVQIRLPVPDKAFVYRLLKKMTSTLPVRDRLPVLKIAVRFHPGNAAMYLPERERQVVVLWLTKLYKVARVRDEAMGARIEKILAVITACT